MINVILSESEVLEKLAQLNLLINQESGDERENRKIEFTNLSKQLQNHIGEFRLQQVLSSEEYMEIYDVLNSVKMANKEIFLKKAELQKKFFETDLTEVKIGYSTPNER